MPAQRGDAISRDDLVSFVLEAVYPVGAVYISTTNVNPATLFGGTWTQLKDRFLVGAGDSYTNGNIGGAASTSYTPSGNVGNHTLTTAEIPVHAHGLNNHTHGVGTYSIKSNGAHSHAIYGANTTTGNSVGSASYSGNGWIPNLGGKTWSADYLVSTPAHGHSMSGSSGAASGNTTNAGSGGAHNHGFTGTAATINTVPPYLAVYMWQRTA